MDKTNKYLEAQYDELYKAYLLVLSEHSNLKLRYQQAIEGSIHDINQMNLLKLENEALKKQLQSYENRSDSMRETLPCTPHSFTHHSFKDPFLMFSPQRLITLSNRESCPDMMPKKIYNTAGKINPSLPDQSPSFEPIDSKTYISFLIIGVSGEKIGRGRAIKPEILYEYPKDNFLLPDDTKQAIINCSFPAGIDARPLSQTSSETELNALIYGQIPPKRGSKCFTFTLRSNQLEGPQGDMPNSSKELLYVFCVEFEDLTCQEDIKVEWIIPKIYCFVTFLPTFELHYEIISQMLLQKRINRMEFMINEENSSESIEYQKISTYEKKLLETYAEIDSFIPESSIEIESERLDKVKYKCPRDLSMIDIPWLCSPLFSSLSFDDFFWLLCAVAQEKSVVFVSANLGLLSSCVMSFQALLRPFKWPNLMIPIIPDSLMDMLDAPIPILVGTSLPVHHKGNLIWVLLDEKNCEEKIKGTKTVLQEVKIPILSELRQKKISILYQFFKGEEICFNPSEVQISACTKIVEVIREFWKKIIDAARIYQNKDINSSLMHFLRQFPEGDHEFLMSMMETQLFSNIYQDFPIEENFLEVPKRIL